MSPLVKHISLYYNNIQGNAFGHTKQGIFQ